MTVLGAKNSTKNVQLALRAMKAELQLVGGNIILGLSDIRTGAIVGSNCIPVLTSELQLVEGNCISVL
ncbi:hypothetical protein SK128_018010 [Halocaridina rubra]|uniref:Uncharacterized protein n=1 Tax=Halocaridina rubra TaxID=373956 RepID=A0AAN8WMN7_HALRR